MKHRHSLLAIGATLLLPCLSWAGVNVQTFNQATSATFETAESGFLDRGPFGSATGRLDVNLGVHYHFADNPLVEYSRDTQERVAVLVDGIHTLQTGVGIQTREWAANLILQAHEVKLSSGGYQTAFGDMKLQGKIQIAQSEDRKRGFVLAPELHFPTGNSTLFVSNGAFGIGLRAALEQEFSSFSAAINIGVLSFGDGVYRDIDYRTQLPYALAVTVPVSAKVSVNGEFFQSITFPRNSLQNPGEAYLGTKVMLSSEMTGNAGLSLGQADFLKSNDVRIHLGVQIRLNPEIRR